VASVGNFTLDVLGISTCPFLSRSGVKLVSSDSRHFRLFEKGGPERGRFFCFARSCTLAVSNEFQKSHLPNHHPPVAACHLWQEPLHAQKPLAASDDLLLATMEKELHRGQFELAKQDPAPYFTSYNVTDGESLVVLARQGGILTSTHARHRAADVSMRIGTPALDNTHDQERYSGISSASFRSGTTPTPSLASSGD